jgi:hypothetical protein
VAFIDRPDLAHPTVSLVRGWCVPTARPLAPPLTWWNARVSNVSFDKNSSINDQRRSEAALMWLEC